MIRFEGRADSASCNSKSFRWEAPVQEFIARENIRRFEAQLDACADPEQRKILSRLLEAERQHLSEALADKQSGSAGSTPPIASA